MQNYYQSFTNTSVWTVTHNLNTTTPIVDAWVTINGVTEKILALDYRIVNENTILVMFSANQTGKIRLAAPAEATAPVSYPPGYTGDGIYLPIEHFDVPVNLPPTATIDTPVGSSVTIDPGGSVNFTATGADPELQPLTFNWNFGGGATNTSEQDPGNVTFTSSGEYLVTLTVSDSVHQTQATRTVIVNVEPGELWTWGRNDLGQLGTNDTNHRSSPVQTIAGGNIWKQLAGHTGHATVIKTDGTLWVWGINEDGQLGTNTITSHSSPVQTVAGGTNWKQVDSGSNFTAATKTDGTLWTWGSNYSGQLGTGDNISRSSPVQTTVGGTNWKSFVSCAQHTLAIKTDGTLWVWGANFYGELGTNDTTPRSSPVQTVAGGTNWKQASGAFEGLSAAIKTDGTLWVWGSDEYGSLGNNTIGVSLSSPVQTVAGGTNWKQVSVGSDCVAAIKTDGTLWMWGRNDVGQLGTNDTNHRSSPVQTVAGGTNWKLVSVDSRTTAAIKTDGTLWVWGNNGHGQLGTNDRAHRSSPVQTVAGGTNWKQVCSNGAHVMAIREYVAPPPITFSLTHQDLNSFRVQNTGSTAMKLTQVTSNPTSLISFPSGQLRGSTSSNFSSGNTDWYEAPATMDITVAAGGFYYFQFVYSWNTGETATVTATRTDGTGSVTQTITK